MNKFFGLYILTAFFHSCTGQISGNKPQENIKLPMENSQTKQEKIIKSDDEWRKELTPGQFHVLREKGTENPFSGKYYKHNEKGFYTCAGCGVELFSSEKKFDAGCGWPSFFESLSGKVDTIVDNSHGMHRIEITCHKCGGHLGHVFDDGPKPTGLRYCVNSESLDFKKP